MQTAGRPDLPDPPFQLAKPQSAATLKPRERESDLYPGYLCDLFRKFGAGGRTRTDDLLITNQLLYQLSYAGEAGRRSILAHGSDLAGSLAGVEVAPFLEHS